MRIKLDENIPNSLVDVLTSLDHDVDTVIAEGIKGHSDDSVWAAAQETQRFLITQDLDFSDLRKFKPGNHHGILLVRLSMPSRDALFKRIEHLFETENVEPWRGCFVVASARKVRIRCP